MKKPVLSHTLNCIIFFFMCCFFSGCSSKHASRNTPVESPKLLGALLPLSGEHQSQGEAVKNGMLWACTQELNPTRCQIKFYDTAATPVSDAYQQAKNDQVQLILGPLLKQDVNNLIHQSHTKPVIALNQNSEQLTPPTHFYELSLAPEAEMNALVKKAIQLQTSRALIISNQTASFQRLHRAFTESWKKSGKTVTETFSYNNDTNFSEAIPALLQSNASNKKTMRNDQQDNATPVDQQQRRRDFDVVVLFASPEEAQAIIPLLRFNYVINTPILASSSVYNGNGNTTGNIDLSTVTICDVRWSTLSALPIPKEKQTRLFALGRDAVMLSQQLSALQNGQQRNLWIGDVQLDSHSQLTRTPHCQRVKSGVTE